MRSALLVAALLLVASAAGCSNVREIEAAQTSRCAACHGFPPLAGLTRATHPASTSCVLCHATTVDADADLLAGGKHQDGHVDVTAHALPYVTQHPAAALAGLAGCQTCHGTDYAGGASGVSCATCHASVQDAGGATGFADWKTNCTFCHGTRTAGWTAADGYLVVAPPPGARGETLPTQRGVGAHAAHLAGGALAAPVACDQCHAVGAIVAAGLAHVDGAAAVDFGDLATTAGAAPQFVAATATCSATYCHGGTLALGGGTNTSPSWTGTAGCGSCHGLPPTSNRHDIVPHVGIDCANCHLDVANPGTFTIIDAPAARALHVNGAKDVRFPVGTWDPAAGTCSNVACHTQPPAVRGWRDAY